MLDALATKLEHYMDLLGKRQQLVSANIANADTTGYKTKDIDFQFEFMSMMEGGTPNVIESPGLPVKNDGNNVVIERERAGCWRKTRCVSIWRLTCCAAKSAACVRPFRKGNNR